MKYTLNDLNLLKYAIDNKAALYVDDGASITRSYESNGYLNLKYVDDDIEKIVTVNFGSDIASDAEAEFLRVMRLKLPIVEILDLVTVALTKGLIIDESGSPEYNLKTYGEFDGDYNMLTAYDGYFVFSVLDDSGIKSYYNINFNRNAKFPRKLHVEYVSRSSMFVKAILDKVMYKYNILIVAKASMSEDSVQPLPLADEFVQLGSGKLEDSDDVIENEIHGQIKVLISYRDTINNESYSERVIDDIYVDKADTDNPEFNVSNIHPSDNDEGVATALRDIPQGERDAIVSIHKLFDRDDIKFKIFDKLRESSYTALSRLIKRRFKNYEKTDDGAMPKMEFTLTPIAIYSNHIVRNIKRYKIAYKNPPEKLRDFSLEYEKVIEPNCSLYHELTVDGEDAPVVLSPDRPLVIALCNNYNTAETPIAVKLPLDDKYVVRLDKDNPDYYGGGEYRGVYFDKRALVIGSQTGYAETPYASKYFLKDDLEECAASGRLYHNSDLVRIDGGIINSVGYLNKKEAGKLVYKKRAFTCPTCKARFGAEQKSHWEKYLNKNVLDDGSGEQKHCCDRCVGLIQDGKAIFKDNSADNLFYVDDYAEGKKLRRTSLCPCCLNSPDKKPEEMTVDTSRKHGKDSTVCKVCGKAVCKKHFNPELGVCLSCAAPAKGSEDFDSGHSLWKPIKRCLRLADRLCKDMVIDEKSSKLGEVRLFCKKPRGTVVYYMYVSDDGKQAVAVRNVKTISDK